MPRQNMETVKLSVTLEKDVAEYVSSFGKRQRSRKMNAILKQYMKQDQRNTMVEGFQQSAEDFESWERLGFENDAWK